MTPEDPFEPEQLWELIYLLSKHQLEWRQQILKAMNFVLGKWEQIFDAILPRDAELGSRPATLFLSS